MQSLEVDLLRLQTPKVSRLLNFKPTALNEVPVFEIPVTLIIVPRLGRSNSRNPLDTDIQCRNRAKHYICQA